MPPFSATGAPIRTCHATPANLYELCQHYHRAMQLPERWLSFVPPPFIKTSSALSTALCRWPVHCCRLQSRF